ncbi:hypothetical protein HK101_011360 [Irineochytrium annulatum]|nr:hypothetical protein HK101_011360 [Irineochytrium annulatum]
MSQDSSQHSQLFVPSSSPATRARAAASSSSAGARLQETGGPASNPLDNLFEAGSSPFHHQLPTFSQQPFGMSSSPPRSRNRLGGLREQVPESSPGRRMQQPHQSQQPTSELGLATSPAGGMRGAARATPRANRLNQRVTFGGTSPMLSYPDSSPHGNNNSGPTGQTRSTNERLTNPSATLTSEGPSSTTGRKARQQREGTDPLFSASTNNGHPRGSQRTASGRSDRGSGGAAITPARFPRGDVNRNRAGRENRQIFHMNESATPRRGPGAAAGGDGGGGGGDGPGGGGGDDDDDMDEDRRPPADPTSEGGEAMRPGRAVIWGTNLNMQEVMETFSAFLTNFTVAHKVENIKRICDQLELEGDEGQRKMTDQLRAYRNYTVTEKDLAPFYPELLKQMKEQERYSMNLDCANLRYYRPTKNFYQQLIRYPEEIIPMMDYALEQTFYELFEDEVADGSRKFTVRPFNLGRSVNMRDLDPVDIDQLVSVKGLMIRTSACIPDLKLAYFRCSQCEGAETAEVDRGRVIEPARCPREECRAKSSMMLIHNRCLFSDKQIARMQETPGKARAVARLKLTLLITTVATDETPDGQTPYTVSICMYDDLVDVAKPGDRLEITGVFRAVPVRPNPNRRSIKSLFKTYVDAVHIKRTDTKRLQVDQSILNDNDFQNNYEESDQIVENEFEEEKVAELGTRNDLYELLARSVAPSIFGMDDVKKGVLLQLFGGANKFQGGKAGAPRIRGDINILLVGDPGVSKSQLLQYVHKLAPRGVYTSGKGSSAVGLTAYVTRDPDSRQLVLESGALVLSDGGVCCIDEFDKMSDFTRSVLHEVMEQQTISVAKAGIITTLNARTSILASANPINSKFDQKLSVVDNVNLPPPLLSRFDLLYLLLDKPSEDEDRRLAQHIVNLYLEVRPENTDDEFVPVQLFAKYINHAKNRPSPVISEQAGDLLVRNYTEMRSLGRGHYGREAVVTATTRQLESMIRLAEAHARMRLSDTVDVADVDEAYRLIKAAILKTATDPTTGRIDIDKLTTGVSAHDRKAREARRVAIRKMLEDMTATDIGMETAYKRYKESTNDKTISEVEFGKVLANDLSDIVAVSTNKNFKQRTIRKIV